VGKSKKILIGVSLGVLVGLLFGDACAPLKVVGTVYIKLMQMTVTPYIILSLILGIGRLSPETARLVAGRGGALLLGTWGLGFLLLLAMPLAFPAQLSSSYYSGPTEIKPIGVDSFIELFIPANIFRALSEELIPSVILFCICLGVVLMKIPNKAALLETLETLAEAIERLAVAVANLTPVGVFAMTAVTAGTMTWTEISRLQVYVLSIFFMALFSSFWLLPMFIRGLFPVPYRRLLVCCREPLLIAFSTGSSFVALPLINEKIRELLREQATETGEGELTAEQASYVSVVLPIAFAFPTLSGFIDLLFIQFTAWSYDTPIGGLQFLKLAALGLPALFSEANAVPFLLQQFHLPLDSFSLYLMSGVIDSYFFSLLSGMSLFTVTLLTVASAAGRLRFQPAVAVSAVAGTVALGGGLLFGLHTLLSYTTGQSHETAPELLSLSLESPVPSRVTPPGARPAPPPGPAPARGRLLEDIVKRHVLRVGYSPDSIPWSYLNARRELVGYDIAFADRLAREMDVSLELVPIDFSRWTDELEERRYDIAMVAFSISPERISKVDFTATHRHLPSVFVVKDFRKEEFTSKESVARIPGLRLAVLEGTKRHEITARAFPGARIVPLARIDDFFAPGADLADAWYTEAGKGYAYSLLHPSFDAVQDTSDSATADAYPIPKGESEWQAYLNAFLRLQRENGFETYNFEKYVLGKHFPARAARWCLARNVFHWLK
jgi:Na+/H+-dicarboxylate symporter/ABC-type amino acid transport substrate-binding protein